MIQTPPSRHYHPDYLALKTNYVLPVLSSSQAGAGLVVDRSRLFPSVVIDAYRRTPIDDSSVALDSLTLSEMESVTWRRK